MIQPKRDDYFFEIVFGGVIVFWHYWFSRYDRIWDVYCV